MRIKNKIVKSNTIIEKLVRQDFYSCGMGCFDAHDYTDEQIKIAYKIVNKLWR